MQRCLVFLLLVLNLFADHHDPYFLAVTEGDPSALVQGMVNVITGDLYFAEEDCVVQGCVPLRLPRFYYSGDSEEKHLGWFFIDHLAANYRAETSEHRITIEDPNGSSFTFVAPAQEIYDRYEYKHKKRTPSTRFNLSPTSTSQGLTNTSQGEITGQNNPKNIYLQLDPDGRAFTVYYPDGTKRYYKAHHKQSHFKEVFEYREPKHIDYFMQWEQLANGAFVSYRFNDHDRLDLIETKDPSNKRMYASAQFHFLNKHKSKDPNFDIVTSDGRRLQYRYEPLSKSKHIFLLRSVVSADSPPESIHYHHDCPEGGPLVKGRALPGDRYYDIDYYRSGHNNVCGKDIKLKKGDLRCRRVKTLSGRVGSDLTLHATHQFLYDFEKRTTDVYEIDGARVRYIYSPERRLEWIERYTPAQTLTSAERYAWSPEGNLLCRAFLDAAKRPLMARRFIYDPQGNPLEEQFYGHFSGLLKTPLSLTAEGVPQGGEVYTIRRKYSQDGRNLLLHEEEPGGKSIAYIYLPNTSLLSAKVVYENGKIKTRNYYEYNQDNIVIREVFDNGSASNPQDLSGVTVRKIKEITPYPHAPFLNMPHIITEKYWEKGEIYLLNKVVLTYTTGGLISRKDVYDSQDVLRYSLTTSYDSLGRPIEETNALGQTAKHSYDISGNKILFQPFGGQKTQQMAYDYSNRPTALQELGLDGIQHTTRYQYDGKHNKIATTDPYGNTTRYVYDSFGHLTETHLPPVLDAEGKTVYPVLRFAYDSAGREIARTDAKGGVTATQYNSRSQKTFVRHPDGTEEKWVYNLDGALQSHTDPEGYTTSYIYDALGRQISKTDPLGRMARYVYDGLNLLSETDPEDHVTTYTYDGAGRKTAQERCQERTEYGYDSLGRLHSVRTGDLVVYTEYDLLDRKIEERQEDLQGQLLSKETFQYDAAGHLTKTVRYVMDKEAVEESQHDSLGRPILQIDPLGHKTQIVYNEAENILRKHTIDSLGQESIETCDALGRLASLEIKNKEGKTLSREEKFYDLNGHLSRQISTVFPKERTVVTCWEYDLMGRLKTLTEAAGSSEQRITRYTYTPRGLLFETTKPDGVVLTRQYDAACNLKTLNSSDHSVSYTYLYNSLNQLIESQDHKTRTTTRRQLDPQGRILEEKLAHELSLKNSYDSQGFRTRLTLSDSSSITYQRDALHLREVTRHDASGRTLYVHRYQEYDLSHHLVSEELIGNLGTLKFNIDPLGRTQTLLSPYFSDQVLEYDPVGNVLRRMTQNHLFTYAYDDLYQLTSESGLFRHAYSFDSHYNRLQKDDLFLEPNSLNQLPIFTYDPNGNPIQSGQFTYTYDALDRLIEIKSATHRLIFTYDSFHRRLTKTVFQLEKGMWNPTEQLFFLYDGQNEIGATDSSGTIVQLRVLGATPFAEIGAAIALELNGKIFAPIHDLAGNIAHLIALDSTSQTTYFYDTFGNISRPSSGPLSPWTFSSKRQDPETGLIFFGRRYLDPVQGRWLTSDPAGFDDCMNLYAFVFNNPLTERDLYGLSIVTNPIRDNPIHVRPISTPPIRPVEIISPPIRAKRISTPVIALPHIPLPMFYTPPIEVSELGRKEHPNIRFSYGNGIWNTKEDARSGAKYLSELIGRYNVHYVCNSTWSVGQDVSRALLERYASLKIGVVYRLKEEWTKYLAENKESIVIHVTMSEGSLHADMTLPLIPEELRRRIHIIAVAPATCISKEMCASVIHFYCKKDPVPNLMALPRARELGQMDTFKEMTLPKKDDKWYKPYKHHHEFQSPIYKKDVESRVKLIMEPYINIGKE
jgi:RHS repeat-associated protein